MLHRRTGRRSIAFDDNKQGEVDKLIFEGYIIKNGDLYELTSER